MDLRAALALLLLLLAAQQARTTSTDLISTPIQVPSILTSHCELGEYRSGGRWCKCCPAGQYVAEPCRSPHTQGKCVKCDRGTFTAFPNGLDSCVLCTTCHKDEEMAVECTATSDRVCQCKAGRAFRLPGSREFCTRCSTCPKGMVVQQKCNATADAACGWPGADPNLWWWLFIVPVVFMICTMTRRGRPCTACHASPDGHGDRGQSMLPESPVLSTPSDEDRNAASAVLVTGASELSMDTLDLVSEAPALSRTLESPTGVSDTQAVADGRGPAPEGPPQPGSSPAAQAHVSGCGPHGGSGTERKVCSVSLKRNRSSDDVRPGQAIPRPSQSSPQRGDRTPISAPS